MAPYHDPVLVFYAIALAWWAALGAAQPRRGDRWAFTPRWHRWGFRYFGPSSW